MATYTLKNPTAAPTEKAFGFAVDLVSKVYTDPALRMELLVSLPEMNAGQISELIDNLKPQAKGANAKVAVTEQPAAVKAIVPGKYVIGGVTYTVKVGKSSGAAYLMAGHDYLGAKSPKAVAILAQIAENGAALAAEYGKLTGSCGVCSKTLTDPKSIAAGIGPVCASKF